MLSVATPGTTTPNRLWDRFDAPLRKELTRRCRKRAEESDRNRFSFLKSLPPQLSSLEQLFSLTERVAICIDSLTPEFRARARSPSLLLSTERYFRALLRLNHAVAEIRALCVHRELPPELLCIIINNRAGFAIFLSAHSLS